MFVQVEKKGHQKSRWSADLSKTLRMVRGVKKVENH